MIKIIYLLWDISGKSQDIVSKKPLSLKKMQKLVGGYIEMVWVGEPYNSHCLMINEDGLSLGLSQNKKFPQLVGNVIEGLMVEGKEGYDFVGF